MPIIPLKKNPVGYTCSAYLVLGEYKTLSDVNALVDVGMDGYIATEIRATYTGVGKKPVDSVVLTHGHFDHAAGLVEIVPLFEPRIFGLQRIANFETTILHDGEKILLGDQEYEVIRTPGHSDDSLCLYGARDKVLFSGDTPFRIYDANATYGEEFILSLEKLARRDIQTVYTGHDGALRGEVNAMIRSSLQTVTKKAS
jgi:glyoxylase-like metal-dependent hydrolase (beta-lactamase superfamily II)